MLREKEKSIAPPRLGSAFTLIELVLCMAIMVIFSAIAAPRYARSIAHYHSDVAARRLAADIQWARSLAQAGSTNQSVSFDVADSTYTLVGVSDPDNAGKTYTVELVGSPYKAKLVSASFGGISTLTFDGFGMPNSAGSVVINCGDYNKTVSVSADNGTVSVQ